MYSYKLTALLGLPLAFFTNFFPLAYTCTYFSNVTFAPSTLWSHTASPLTVSACSTMHPTTSSGRN